jgi:hypothetical protein
VEAPARGDLEEERRAGGFLAGGHSAPSASAARTRKPGSAPITHVGRRPSREARSITLGVTPVLHQSAGGMLRDPSSGINDPGGA